MDGWKIIVSFWDTLPETNIAPENGWLMMVGRLLSYWVSAGLFSGATFAVRFRVPGRRVDRGSRVT